MDNKTIKRLFTLDGTVIREFPIATDAGISAILDEKEQAANAGVSKRNADYFENEAEKRDG